MLKGLTKSTTIEARFGPEKAPTPYLFVIKLRVATHLIETKKRHLLIDKGDRLQVASIKERLVIELLLRV